mgnify:CR=1 FL=1
MSVTEILVLVATGLLAGLASGSLGIGGGIIVVPALVFLLGMSQHEAQGTSLAFLLPPIGILAVANYYKEGYVNYKYALILAAAFIIGGYLGSLISMQLPAKVLKQIFAVFMIVVAIKMLIGK